MDYRLLGRSGLKICTITIGTMTFGGVGWTQTIGQLNLPEGEAGVNVCGIPADCPT